MINAEKLTFGFNDSLLFQDISFTLEENCHCALIGSNGSGKTTLTNLIQDPANYIFEGKLNTDGAGRIGYVSQFAVRDGDQSVTVYDYLCQDFLALEHTINEVCLQMESAEDLDTVMEHYQGLLDESAAIDADNCEGGSINALEIFVYKDTVSVKNSRGIDKTEVSYRAMVEAIPTWNGEESVELYEQYKFTELDREEITREIAQKMREVRFHSLHQRVRLI